MALEPGTYKPQNIIDYGISKTQKGEPQAFIIFQLEGGKITWYGSFGEGGKDITIKSLLYCGFKGHDLSSLTLGLEGDALVVYPDIELVLENDTYNGKTNLKVQWINKPYQVKRMEQSTAVTKMQGMNLGGDLMRIAKEAGVTLGGSPDRQFINELENHMNGENPLKINDDDIPF